MCKVVLECSGEYYVIKVDQKQIFKTTFYQSFKKGAGGIGRAKEHLIKLIQPQRGDQSCPFTVLFLYRDLYYTLTRSSVEEYWACPKAIKDSPS